MTIVYVMCCLIMDIDTHTGAVYDKYMKSSNSLWLVRQTAAQLEIVFKFVSIGWKWKYTPGAIVTDQRVRRRIQIFRLNSTPAYQYFKILTAAAEFLGSTTVNW